MMRTAVLLATILAPSLSSAATFTTTSSAIITAGAAGSYSENGVGAPSLTFDSSTDKWVMLFETQVSDAYMAGVTGDFSDCGGVWGVGMATADSLAGPWTTSDEPLLMPARGTYYECKIAHPKIVKDGSTWYVFFTTYQDSSPCDGATPPWGCTPQTGVGVASLTSLSSPNPTFTERPALPISQFGYPSAVKLDGVWHLWVAKLPDLHLATRAGDPMDGEFSLVPGGILGPGANAWTPDRVSNPGTTCVSGSRYPFQQLIGGKTLDPATGKIASHGVGEATSADGREFFLSSLPDFSFVGGGAGWRHWDLHRFEGDNACDQGFGEQYVAPYAERNTALAVNEIWLAHTAALNSYAAADLSHKVCTNTAISLDAAAQPFSAGSGDTGAVPASLYDTGTQEAQAGGGCNTSGSTPLGFLMLLPALLLLRRQGE